MTTSFSYQFLQSLLEQPCFEQQPEYLVHRGGSIEG